MLATIVINISLNAEILLKKQQINSYQHYVTNFKDYFFWLGCQRVSEYLDTRIVGWYPITRMGILSICIFRLRVTTKHHCFVH